MSQPSFSVRYAAAMAKCGERCPIEAGLLGRLADHECRHGRLPFDRMPPAVRPHAACVCWMEEGAVPLALPRPAEEPVASRHAA
jgi:hypothetical protein